MTEPSQNHWTDDEELLEQYILGQLPAERKRELDTHLEACERCRSAVSFLGGFISGIRRFGREGIKSRLAIRVALERRRRKNWFRYAGIAAAILFIVVDGLQNDWFFDSGKLRNERRVRVDSLRRNISEEPDDQNRPAEGLAGNAPKSEKKKEMNHVVSPANGAEKDKQQPVRMLSPGDVAAVAVPPEEGVNLLSVSAEPYDTISFWLEGAFVGGRLEKSAALSPAGNVTTAAGLEARARTKGLARMASPTRTQELQPDPVLFTLAQRPLSEFPVSLSPKRNNPGAVPAQLKIVGPRARLTFFLDSLFTPSQFLAATVETVRPDSIVVIIGGRKIGCAIPPGAVRIDGKDVRR